MVTINSVARGIRTVVKTHFPNAKVTGEEVKQIEAPCFSVLVMPTGQDKELGNRYSRTHTFIIRYFPESEENIEIHDVAEKLYDILELVEIDGLLYRGTSMTHEIDDRTLRFMVDYNFHVKRETPEIPKMQSLEQEEYVHER